jgi:hypothetical protein
MPMVCAVIETVVECLVIEIVVEPLVLPPGHWVAMSFAMVQFPVEVTML